MSDGLKIPDSVSDCAHIVADVIELHLTWEIHNLKSSICPSAAVNSFGEFAAIFIPQIQGLADTAFFGGEDTDDLRAEITDVVLKLMRWIVEQSAMLAEHVIPEHLSSEPGLRYDEGVKAIWDLDTCMEMACQQKLQSFPRSELSWVFDQTTWPVFNSNHELGIHAADLGQQISGKDTKKGWHGAKPPRCESGVVWAHTTGVEELHSARTTTD